MPYRVGYFALAYAWDHHCRRLYDTIEGRIRQAEREAAQLEGNRIHGQASSCDYVERRQGLLDISRHVLSEIRKREYVINSLGYRGYGVNRDLLVALATLAERAGRLQEVLQMQFAHEVGPAWARIDQREMAEGKPSDHALAERCEQPCRLEYREGLGPAQEGGLDLSRYWQVMAKETPFEVNTVIFERMFFAAGCSSMTIMKGSTGFHKGESCQELKLGANRDFVRTVRTIFAGLSAYTEIGIGILRDLHHQVHKHPWSEWGSFREIDFPDRNGVTFEFGNFYREVSDLAIVLDETARSFHNLNGFIYNLARSYYMLIGIHPFWDGNGRVGRCFLNLFLLKKGLPPVTLDNDEEVLALPRYGGSMEDMHDYLKKRLRQATATYLYERHKIEAFDLLGERIHNLSFDSGFYFRQINGQAPQIEVNFEVVVIDNGNDLSRAFMDESRIVLADEGLLPRMTVYWGLCEAPLSQWRHAFSLRQGIYFEEIASDREGLKVFDVDFRVKIPRQARRGDSFACSIVFEEQGLIFNNKGLNYSYPLDL